MKKFYFEKFITFNIFLCNQSILPVSFQRKILMYNKSFKVLNQNERTHY